MERDLWQYLKTAQKPIVLYGMGNGADKIIKVLEQNGISFEGVFASDGFQREKLFHGKKIESYADLKKRFGEMIVLLCFGSARPEVIENVKRISLEQELYAPEVPVIGGGLFDLEYYQSRKEEFDLIYSHLADQKSKETFLNVIKYKISGKLDYLFNCEVTEDEPYSSFLAPRENECFLDLGAYNGDTALEFARKNPDYEKIIAVEPDKKTFKKLVRNTENIKNITNLNLCVSDFTGVGHFCMNAGRNSVIGATGEEAEFSTVDDIVKTQKITFIKMDVEGEEEKAIAGSRETILTRKPRMLISAYHRTEDLISLPKAVLSIRDDYKIYMRHFVSLPAWDTVYYFV